MATRNTTIRDRHRAAIRRAEPDCYLCHQPIDYTAHWLDPLSFTVDHIQPLSKGGLDILENKAAAHRKCNRTKSDKTLTVPAITSETSRTW